MSYIVGKYPVHIFQLNYMQPGHSFLPNDADFGVVEKPRKLQVMYIYLNIGWMSLEMSESEIRSHCVK